VNELTLTSETGQNSEKKQASDIQASPAADDTAGAQASGQADTSAAKAADTPETAMATGPGPAPDDVSELVLALEETSGTQAADETGATAESTDTPEAVTATDLSPAPDDVSELKLAFEDALLEESQDAASDTVTLDDEVAPQATVDQVTVTDPAMEHGALGEGFKGEAVDPDRWLKAHESAVANRLAAEGYRVDARPRDEEHGQKNPDAMVRRSPDDPGVVTEFKTLETTNPNRLAEQMRDGSSQVEKYDGEVVVDGRAVGTTKEQADAAYKRAWGGRGLGIPKIAKTVYVILGDDTIVAYPRALPRF
jgi:hypothetical protein